MWPLGLLFFFFVCILLWGCPSVRGHLQFSGLFFVIFTAIGLKLGVLLCSQELLFQFAFQCDWFIFARVTPLHLGWILRIFQFSIFSIAIFAAIGLKLGILLCTEELQLHFMFRCYWIFFSELNPLVLEKSLNLTVFWIFWNIFAPITLKFGLSFCSKEL